MDKTKICPVCSKPQQDTNSLDCPHCSVSYAFQTLFSSEDSYKVWRRKITAEKQLYERNRNKSRWKKLHESGSYLLLGVRQVIFYNGVSKEAVVFGCSKESVRHKDVEQVSVSNLNTLFLKTDGSVVCEGDTYYCQDNLSAGEHNRYVEATQNSTCVVNSRGGVDIYGASPLRDEVSSWNNISKLSGSASHLAGLTTDGTVVLAGKSSDEVSGWNNVKKVVAIKNDTVALHKDGTVSYDGYDTTKKNSTAAWRDITDVVGDSLYIVGLTKTKHVKLAGKQASDFLDLNRRTAAEWTDVEFIAAGNSAIAAVTSGGELKIVGNFFDTDRICKAFKEEIDRITAES